MIPRRILLTIITIRMLLPTFAYSAPDSTGTRNDTVAIEVLEERVKGNAENTKDQIESLQKLLDAQNDALNQRITDHDDASNKQIELILWIVGFILTFLTFLASYFGPRTITGWIKQTISDKTDALIEQHKTGLAEQAKKASEEWARVDKARDEYDSMKDRMEKKVKELAGLERRPVEPGDKTPEFQEKLSTVKDEGDYTAEDWHYLGNEAFERGDLEEAVKCFTNSIKINPNEYWSYNNRGIAFSKLGRYDQAFKDYEEAIMLAPEKAEAYGNRGNVLDELERYDEALTDLDKAIELDSNYTAAYNNRGATLDNMERFDEALMDYKRAIALEPKYVQPHSNRGITLGKQGLYPEALVSFNKALRINPEYKPALTNAAELNILLGHFDIALQHVSKALILFESSEDKAQALYLKCIALKLLDKSTSATETGFDQILEDDFEVTWSFDMFEGWLETADISDETREFIEAKTAMLKAKKK